MLVVVFEVEPREGLSNEYLRVAKLLRPELEAMEGFIDNTRYASRQTSGRLLALSTWRDERSLVRWRAHATHHESGQRRGRFEIFADYRLRIAEFVDGEAGPRQEESEIAIAKAVTIAGPTTGGGLPNLFGRPGLVDSAAFDGILPPNEPILLSSWVSLADARLAFAGDTATQVRYGRVVREYGMQDRREAPQYLPDVEPPKPAE